MDGKLDNVDLSEVELRGTDIHMVLVEPERPDESLTLTCKDVYVFSLRRSDDAPPYFVGSLIWRSVLQGAARDMLAKSGYSHPEVAHLLQVGSFMEIQIEGGVEIYVICGSMSFDRAQAAGSKA